MKLLSTFKQRSPPLEVDRKAGIPFPTKEGNGPSSQDEEGKTRLLLSCGGTLGVPLEWSQVCRGLVKLPKVCQGPFQAQEGRWNFFRDATVEKGLISHGGVNLLFFLKLWQETGGSSQVTMETSWNRLCCLRKVHSPCELEGSLGIPLHLVQGPRSSSRVEAGTSVFLSSAAMEFSVPMEFQQWCQASSRVETWMCAFLSSCKSSVRLPVELTYGSEAYSRGATGLSYLTSCFESARGVTVESVPGNKFYLEWIGATGSL